MRRRIFRKNPDKLREELNITGGGGPTNLSYNAATRVVASSTGTDATLTLADGTNPGLLASADFTKLSNTSGTNTGDNATNSQYSGLAASKQDTLVSGTNIKTINSNSLLGSGNISLADFSGPASSIDGEAVVFDGTTGKLGKRATSSAKFPIVGLAATTFGASEVLYSGGVGNEAVSSSAFTYNGTTVNATQFNGVALTAAGSSSNYLREDGTYGTPFSGLAKITVGTSTPGSPGVGDLWIDTN